MGTEDKLIRRVLVGRARLPRGPRLRQIAPLMIWHERQANGEVGHRRGCLLKRVPTLRRVSTIVSHVYFALSLHLSSFQVTLMSNGAAPGASEHRESCGYSKFAQWHGDGRRDSRGRIGGSNSCRTPQTPRCRSCGRRSGRATHAGLINISGCGFFTPFRK